MSETKLAYKIINGRKVKQEIVFEKHKDSMAFTGYYKGIDFLIENGYCPGFMDGHNPVGIYSKDHKGFPPPKWHKMIQWQKDALIGILMSSDYRNDDVKIIFFED